MKSEKYIVTKGQMTCYQYSEKDIVTKEQMICYQYSET